MPGRMDDSSWAQLVVKHGLIRESYQIFCRKRTPHPAFSCHKSKTLRDLHLITNFSVSISLSGPIRISQTRSTWHNAAPISDLESKFELVTTIMNLCVFFLDQSLCRPSRIQTAAQTWQTEVPCDATGSWRMYGKKAMVSCRWQ
jgi:hypothetical protein